MSEIAELRAIALRAAQVAARILTDRFHDIRQIDYKGRINLVTDADHRAEEAVVAFLSRECSDHGIVGEEGTQTNQQSAYRWYVDPLDGTTNYAHGLPIFATSAGVTHQGERVAGAVVAPLLGETFVAARGSGAFLNDAPIRVSATDELLRGLLVTGFPYEPTPETDNMARFATLARRAQAVRRLGSAALDCCWVAAGRFDGYWEGEVFPWDLAGGALIVEEAGGCLSDLRGGPFDLLGRQIVASNGRIHDALVAALGEHLPDHRATR